MFPSHSIACNEKERSNIDLFFHAVCLFQSKSLFPRHLFHCSCIDWQTNLREEKERRQLMLNRHLIWCHPIKARDLRKRRKDSIITKTTDIDMISSCRTDTSLYPGISWTDSGSKIAILSTFLFHDHEKQFMDDVFWTKQDKTLHLYHQLFRFWREILFPSFRRHHHDSWVLAFVCNSKFAQSWTGEDD